MLTLIEIICTVAALWLTLIEIIWTVAALLAFLKGDTVEGLLCMALAGLVGLPHYLAVRAEIRGRGRK